MNLGGKVYLMDLDSNSISEFNTSLDGINDMDFLNGEVVIICHNGNCQDIVNYFKGK